MKISNLISWAAMAAIALSACAAPTPTAPAATAAPATAAPAPATAVPAPPKPTDVPKPTEAPKPAGPKETKDMKILVSMKGPGGGNPFWAAVEKGAKDAGAATGAQVSVLAPPAETDVPAQIAQIEDQIAKGVDGIAIAPTDPAALKSVLEKAIAKGVKVVFIDTKGTNDGVTFIGTNNEVGAKLAGDYICKNLQKGDKVAILQGIVTQSTGKARADGSKAALTACGLNVVAERPGEWDKAKGQAAMEDILTKNPDLKGVFGSNDNMALGAVQAIKNAKLGGKVLVVGFDANPDAADAVIAGDMAATVAQAPVNMGKFGVESIIKLVKGDKLDAVIDTGTVLVDKANAATYGSGKAAAPAAGAAIDGKGKKILVSMKGPGGGNPFWAAVEKGAKEAGAATGAEVSVLAPPAETDVPAQIAQIEDQIAKGVQGIAIAPTDPAALKSVLEKAIAKGVKVVFIDTKGTNDGVTFIGTNNEVGAKLAGDYICKNLQKGDKVAILQGIVTQSTGKARADGAKAALTACGLNVVAERPAEWDKAKGQAAMEDILTKNPDLKGVFGSNDNMALGAVQAIKNAKLSGKVLVVGFDANPDAAAAVLAGDMAATIAQAPVNMGKFGVESVLKLLAGTNLDPVVDTGTVLVDKSNAANYK